ncbi:MAG: tetraacyldisaccharide 4'-kinase [Elusimicrobiales bacterium]|nr:tetraacyldisaccharide 4'-kinase [Elusimicrobiales bacterium]
MNLLELRDNLKKNCIGRFLLYFLTAIYYIGFEINKFVRIFFKNFVKRKKNYYLICVGNISTGGTGKTTFVIELAKKINSTRLKTIIITRGYKSKFKKNDVFDFDYSMFENLIGEEKISDEQKLMALILRKEKIPIIASKNRKKAIKFALEKYKPNVIIFDDGYQNFNFNYDYSIVLINPNQIYEKLLPFGNLREPYSGIKRANLVFINHYDIFENENIKKIEDFLSKYISIKKILKGSYTIEGFEEIINIKTYPKDYFLNKEIAVFCGIGDNDQFINYLVKLGAKPIKIWKYPDHYQYTEKDLISIENIRQNLPLVTTMKDAVRVFKKIKNIFKSEFYVAKISIKIEKEFISEIVENIKIKLKNENNI